MVSAHTTFLYRFLFLFLLRGSSSSLWGIEELAYRCANMCWREPRSMTFIQGRLNADFQDTHNSYLLHVFLIWKWDCMWYDDLLLAVVSFVCVKGRGEFSASCLFKKLPNGKQCIPSHRGYADWKLRLFSVSLSLWCIITVEPNTHAIPGTYKFHSKPCELHFTFCVQISVN